MTSRPPNLSRLYGLIIGINNYKEPRIHPNLLGCVGDAKLMLKYFTDKGVPENNFKCLFDQEATRDGILNAFVNNLINNPSIQPHDPIVIYYAGHGDRMRAPHGWQSTDGVIEMILPHDASTWDTSERYIHGIPDLTLAFLLYKLSQEKGNNITVILDSCHSGSGTRGEIRARNSHDPNAPPVPNELDGKLRRSLAVDYPSEVEHNVTSKQDSGTLLAPSLETHVLLAACRDDELAQEIPNVDEESGEVGDPPSSGVFTTALLKELGKCNLATTSYTTLIRNLLAGYREYLSKSTEPLLPQTFQCEGRNQDRLLFSVQYSVSKGKISLITTTDKAVYRVRVGTAQGVVAGTEFGVFSTSMSSMAPPLAILVAKDVGPMSSHLHGAEPNSPPDIPKDAYVTILRYNDHSNGVRIWVDEAVKELPPWKEALASLKSLPVSWAASREGHDIELLPSKVGVELRGAHLIPGQIETSHTIDHGRTGQQLAELLAAVVYFHFHLKIRNKNAPVRTQLGMALRELIEKDNSWGSIIYEAKGDNLFGNSLAAGTVATLYPDTDKAFGLELTNHSGENLYPYVLYYDFEDYSVGCLYEPPSRSGRPPLQAGGTLAIGYGSSGSQPFQVDFTNPESDKEYGAFVLLVFSEWVDITYLQQESPLEAKLFESRGERRGRYTSSVWDNIIVRVEMVKRK
ncbi:caspase domain-containing protein [Rhizoctonia solani]|nr:caspase domain-containing protein [Rhizoctonia solani]